MSSRRSLIRHTLGAREWRARALAGLVVLAALGNARMLKAVRSHYSADRTADETALAIDRFAELRRALPPGAVVGYLGDGRQDSARRQVALDRARFALSPRCVVFSLSQTLVVADFPEGEPPGVPGYLQLQSDYGRGVRLYRNLEAR